jgi:hypothetical protein
MKSTREETDKWQNEIKVVVVVLVAPIKIPVAVVATPNETGEAK